MNSCRVTRRHLLEVVRGNASEAVCLQVESHLEECEECRVERARWGLVGLLKEQPAPTLSGAAQRRVLTRLLDAGVPPVARRASSRRRPWLVAAGLAGAGAAAALMLAAHAWTGRDRARVDALTEPQRIEATAPGSVSFGGARVVYVEGAKMLVDPPRRRLALARGEVDVDVDAKAGLPGRFRVVTDRFIVEVVGTRFVVTPTGVRTLRGRVRILDLAEKEITVLAASESWTVPAATLAPAVSPAPPAAPEAPPALMEAPPAPARAAPAGPVSAAQLLARGRAAMSDGDVTAARAWFARARASGPSDAEAAALDLLEADAWLVGKQTDEAIAAYRRVATRWFGTPEAETAAFAVGQLLAEGDSVLAAQTALTEYLAHYPHGRFVREATEQLAELRASK
jgi:Tetratricopeptide repeat